MGRLIPRRVRLPEQIRSLITGLTAIIAAYLFLLRPRLQSWGATKDEESTCLPGDDRLPKPTLHSTRAITISTPPAAVWPWLVQMGPDRAGNYTYRWLENLFGHDGISVDWLVPRFQELNVGHKCRIGTRERFGGFQEAEVAQLIPRRALVLVQPGATALEAESSGAVLSFVLQPLDESRTRLIVRSRSRPESPLRWLMAALLEPLYFLEDHGRMVGIKQRAEEMERRPSAPPSFLQSAIMAGPNPRSTLN